MANRVIHAAKKNWRVLVGVGGFAMLIASLVLFDALIRVFPKSGKKYPALPGLFELFELFVFASLLLGKLLWFLVGISMVIAALFPGEHLSKKHAAERSID